MDRSVSKVLLVLVLAISVASAVQPKPNPTPVIPVDVGAVGTSTITASLAPASYSPAKYVQTVVSGTSSATDLSLFTPKVWVAKGATIDVPLTARLLSNGSPLSGGPLIFRC